MSPSNGAGVPRTSRSLLPRRSGMLAQTATGEGEPRHKKPTCGVSVQPRPGNDRPSPASRNVSAHPSTWSSLPGPAASHWILRSCQAEVRRRPHWPRRHPEDRPRAAVSESRRQRWRYRGITPRAWMAWPSGVLVQRRGQLERPLDRPKSGMIVWTEPFPKVRPAHQRRPLAVLQGAGDDFGRRGRT